MDEQMDHEMLVDEKGGHLDIVRTKAFSNPLIFLKILHCLPRPDLLQCRKVSHHWCDLSTEVLGVVGVEFEYSHMMGCFMLTPQRPAENLHYGTIEVDRPHFWFQDTLKKRHERIFRPQTTFVEDFYTLHSFTKMISQNIAIQEAQNQDENQDYYYQYPASLFSSFKIGFAGFYNQRVNTNEPNTSVSGNVYDKDVREFLSRHGSRVKELNVDLYADDNGGSFEFLGILLRRVVNLEKLNIGIHGHCVFRFGSETDRQLDERFDRRERWIEFAMERQLNFFHPHAHGRGMLADRSRPRRQNPLHVLAQNLSNVQLSSLNMILYHTLRHGSDNNNGRGTNQETTNGLGELKTILSNISPNLKPEGQMEVLRYAHYDDHWTTTFIPMQRVETVHSLTFNPHPANLKLYEQFAKSHPKLSCILFDMKAISDEDFSDDTEFQQRVLHILQTILESSSYTLKEVQGRDKVENLGYLVNILPLLPPESTEDENQNNVRNNNNNFMNAASKKENNHTNNNNNNNNYQVPISILENVLKYIPHSDLLSNTRLVDKDWCDISTKILLDRKAICINFVHYYHIHRFVRDQNAPNLTSEMIRKDSKDGFTEDFQTLHSLNTLIRRSSRPFPCVRFGLYNGILDSRDLKEFINLYGSKVKGLDIDLIEYSSKIPGKILQFIQEELPNLELLTLSKTHADRRYNTYIRRFNGQSIKSSPMSIISPICKLKSQFFNDKEGEKIWSEQIHSTVFCEPFKLEFRQIQPCDFTIDKINHLRNSTLSDNSITVTHLEFKYDADTMDLNKFIMEMEEFISTKPKLWTINFNFMNLNSLNLKVKEEEEDEKVSFKLLRLVEQILKNNQGSLIDIQGLDQITQLSYLQENDQGEEEEEEQQQSKHFLSTITFHSVRSLLLNHVKIPEISIVENRENDDAAAAADDDNDSLPLKRLCLGHESKLSHSKESSLSFLPSGCKIRQCFPNLFKVTLNYVDYEISYENDENIDSLPNVNTLVIINSGGPSWLKKMSQMFPNVNELSWIVKKPQYFSPLAPSIWEHFSGLKKLTLDFDWRSPIVIGQRDKLDGGFTGFTEKTCAMMEDRKEKMKDVEANQFRANASIFNLKELSHLQMIFRDDSSPDEPRNFWSSQVAGRYAFDKLSLKALIRLRIKTTKANHEKYQAAIAPFASYFYTDFEVVEKQ